MIGSEEEVDIFQGLKGMLEDMDDVEDIGQLRISRPW
jgi:hypothetical protein